MAKAEPLTMEALKTPQVTPQAATPARSPAAQETPQEARKSKQRPAKEEKEHLQIRLLQAEARAIRVAAAERGETISDFMLSCFHDFMKRSNKGDV
jgi:hypothetical protein